jgi:hypothetical protein
MRITDIRVKRGYTQPRPQAPKPKPTISTITFTKEEQEDIDSMLIGSPTVLAEKYFEKNGWTMEQKKQWFTPAQVRERRRQVYTKYKIGVCHLCAELPAYKVIYPYDGVNLVEYYCTPCFEKHGPK